jgi:hypothetical protein
MGKVIGLLLCVLGIWAATQYAAGTSPFSNQHEGEPSNAAAAGAKVSEAFEQGNARRDALLAE